MQDEKEVRKEEETDVQTPPQAEREDDKKSEKAAEKEAKKERKLLKKDKTAELEKRIQELEEEVEKQKNAYFKAYADTENMKRRLQSEAESTRKYRIQSFALEVLPVLDSMERALAAQSDEEAVQNYVKGFAMIHDQLVAILEKEGVKEIEALHKPFDHNVHQALMQEPVEGVESGVVVEVLQKGYMLKDRVLRAALVKVSE